jgi:predicted DNA-binding ribbon-helix-helix protein
MGIDPERQVNASVVLEKDIYERIKAFAKSDRRSVSNLMAIWLEDRLKIENMKVKPSL